LLAKVELDVRKIRVSKLVAYAPAEISIK